MEEFLDVTKSTEEIALCFTRKYKNDAINQYFSMSEDVVQRELEIYMQDLEFEESLKVDIEKDKRMKEAKLQIERAKQELAESKQRNEFEKEKYRNYLQKLKSSLPKEPILGDKNTFTIAVRFPCGNKIQRRFKYRQKIQSLRDFIEVSANLDLPRDFKVTSYDISQEHTFQKMGLTCDTCVYLSYL